MKLTLNYDDKAIKGEVLHHEDGSTVGTKEIGNGQFIGNMKRVSDFNVGLMPPAPRWISRDKAMVVFERPPMRQLIEYIPRERIQINESRDNSKITQSFELEIPWTSYLVYFDKSYLPVTIKVFVRNSFLTSMEDRVHLLPLLNFYNNSQLCNPGQGTFEGLPKTLGEGINMAYNMVWNSGWNFDLKDALDVGYRHGMPRKLRGLYDGWDAITKGWHLEWSRMTRDEVLQCTWPDPSPTQRGTRPEPMTLARMIEYTVGEMAHLVPNPGRNFMVHTVGSLV